MQQNNKKEKKRQQKISCGVGLINLLQVGGEDSGLHHTCSFLLQAGGLLSDLLQTPSSSPALSRFRLEDYCRICYKHLHRSRWEAQEKSPKPIGV